MVRSPQPAPAIEGTKVKGWTIVAMMALACSGCLHSPPNYPGAGGNNIDPADYASVACPDLSGRYEGRGELLDGDATAQGWAKTMRIDYVFPFASSAEAMTFMSAERSDRSRTSYPKYGKVTRIAERSFQVSVIYENGKRASRALLFEEKGRFVCTGSHGKIIWGGASKGGRSEFGPNTTDSMAMLYLDDQGNLVSEDSMQIHMSLQLGGIPTGTAKHFSKYRFKRVPE
ncbi:putative lipoprotein [Cupriavidus taiwanensis]|nr:putative lipoprotein [Cupriavidus taiwanensis]SOZ50333.1 putative lipoprotein [Cupriavidus taiwanensis]SOZ75674.1 putative lipoprotein [Cupriavidus taiwanensis]SOZ76143.1 putative lipoprotein [Cupriavidus taiwanensis]SOZ79337.1 putative lipoprotein [Cupriavidus taiwanensis]